MPSADVDATQVLVEINRSGFYPNYETFREIDDYLLQEWGIDYLFDLADLFAMQSSLGMSAYKKFDKLVEKCAKSGNEHNVMQAMAHFDVHKLQISQSRRHYVIDQIAIAHQLVQARNIRGEILDVGCHNGVLLKYLATRFNNRMLGLDPVKQSIGSANDHAQGLNNLRFVVGRIPGGIGGGYELITCLDVLHHLPSTAQAVAADSIFRAVADGGVVLISTADWQDDAWWEAIRPAMEANGMGLSASGIVGGSALGGSEELPARWESSGIGIFEKSGMTNGPIDASAFRNQADAYWGEFFAPYANAATTPWREKTTGFEASRRQRNSAPY